MREVFKNNAASLLDGAINNSVTSLVVDSGAAFPTDGQFRIKIDDELMLVTNVSTNTLTVTRGAESTTATSHLDNAPVTHILTTESLLKLLYDNGISGNSGDALPITAGTYDEEFNGTADTLPTNWAWTSAPSGSDTWTLNSRWPSLLTVEGTGNTSYVLTRSSFAPTGDFGLWFKVFNGAKASSDNSNVQVRIGNSTYSETKGFQYRCDAVDNSQIRWIENKSGAGIGVAFSGLNRGLARGQNHLYVGLTRTSNVWKPWYSLNGIAWDHAGLSTDSHTFTVDKIEFTFGTEAHYSMQGIDWMRFRADVVPPRIS